MAAARRRIIGEFYYATEKNPRYRLVSGSAASAYRQLHLGRDVSGRAGWHVVIHATSFHQAEPASSEMGELHPGLVEKLIRRVQQEIVLEVILTIRNREVWYDEGVGIWQACQSSIDDFLEYCESRRRLGDVKVDDRSYHGRVRAQSKARGVPEGVSQPQADM